MKNKLSVMLGLVGIVLFVGCEKGDSPSPAAKSSPPPIGMDMPPPSTVEVHSHPSEGPHHGTLVELGKEEFHAELVHDAKSVVIYILDSVAKNAVPIDASEVIVNLLHDGPKADALSAEVSVTGAPVKFSKLAVYQLKSIWK